MAQPLRPDNHCRTVILAHNRSDISIWTVRPSGIIDIDDFTTYVENTLLPSLNIKPTTFVLILTKDMTLAENDYQICCVLGFHAAYGSPMQVFSTACLTLPASLVFSRECIRAVHELAEAVNDPTGLNPTPSWGHIGQVQGCQNNFEVGDPLTGTLMPPVTLNGFTYALQELAFYSWFFSTSSQGINGWYSTNGTFTSDAGPVCH